MLPGVRSGQSLPAVSGTFIRSLLTTTTPWTIGVRPTLMARALERAASGETTLAEVRRVFGERTG